MKENDKQVFRELRAWCARSNAEIYIENDPYPQIYVRIECDRVFSLEGHFDAIDRTVTELDGIFEELGHVDFMEKE